MTLVEAIVWRFHALKSASRVELPDTLLYRHSFTLSEAAAFSLNAKLCGLVM
jgi:hypothetical protein